MLNIKDALETLLTNPEKKSQRPLVWTEVALSIGGGLASFSGARNPELLWLSYLGAFVLIVALIAIGYHAGVGRTVSAYLHRRKKIKVLRRYAQDYADFESGYNDLVELKSAVDNLEWKGQRPRFSGHPCNSFQLIGRLNSELSQDQRFMVVNTFLRLSVEEIDDYLAASAQFMRQGVVNYKNEQEESRVQKMLRSYEAFVRSHNEFCSKINRMVGEDVLTKFYTAEFFLGRWSS